MELKEIQQKWSLIRPENVSGFRSLRMSGICKPDLFIAVDEKGDRCLLLRLPPEGKPGFQPSEKRNLSLAFFKEKRIIVLKLHYKEFNDLFDDLILSLYHKVKDIENSKEYIREFVQCFYKWSEFFDNRQPDKLSVEKIQGLIGEILVLNDLIKDGDPTYVDDILRSWRGPFEDVHDFIFQDRSIEVKTRDAANADVSISSEYQLQQEQGKDLKLVVVTVIKDPVAGFSLKDVVDITKGLVAERLGDISILYTALQKAGVVFQSVGEYDIFRFLPEDVTEYDCLRLGFPKIVRENLLTELNKVRYNLRVNLLRNFISTKKNFNGSKRIFEIQN